MRGRALRNQLTSGASAPFIMAEQDPNGLDAHTPGAKLDAGKCRPGLVLGGFARALWAVSEIGSYGAVKYTENGWMQVPNGTNRYNDAKLRHWLKEQMGQDCDPDTEMLHAAHEAWNSLARLDLMIRQKEKANLTASAVISVSQSS